MKIGTRIRDLEVVENYAASDGNWMVKLKKVGPNCFGVKGITQKAATEVRCDALILKHCNDFSDMNDPAGT